MVCYAVPLSAFLIGVILRFGFKKTGTHSLWLLLMLLGGSVFGVVDHFWNGELFLIGANIYLDLALGVTITAGIFASWGVIVYRERITGSLKHLDRKTGIYK